MFIDTAVIEVRSGKGGDGVVAFRREKYIPKGGPSGGDGGRGGDVWLIAEHGIDTLLDFSGRHHWAAEDGQPGQSRQMHGRDGTDLAIKLPPGTLVYDNTSGELLFDLNTPGQKHLIARGGKGGFGNDHFKTATHQAPRHATPGEPAQSLTLRLELKLIADAGLIGKPNAGKSTLLSVVSKATPKIADYPFTTLEPQLGIAELSADHSGARRLVFADIPGLIEGASGGAGLGIQFLRHVERTRMLVHLLEAAPMDGSDPLANYHTIRHELAAYSPELAAKREIVVLSKMDLLPDEASREALAQRIEQEVGRRVLRISAATRQGIRELLEACWRGLGDHRLRQGWQEAPPQNAP
jgi:GTP-binding protein